MNGKNINFSNKKSKKETFTKRKKYLILMILMLINISL